MGAHVRTAVRIKALLPSLFPRGPRGATPGQRQRIAYTHQSLPGAELWVEVRSPSFSSGTQFHPDSTYFFTPSHVDVCQPADRNPTPAGRCNIISLCLVQQ